jgi:hypothetical protein
MSIDQAVLIHTTEDVVDLSAVLAPRPAADVLSMRNYFLKKEAAVSMTKRHWFREWTRAEEVGDNTILVAEMLEVLEGIEAAAKSADRSLPASARATFDTIAEAASGVLNKIGEPQP